MCQDTEQLVVQDTGSQSESAVNQRAWSIMMYLRCFIGGILALKI